MEKKTWGKTKTLLAIFLFCIVGFRNIVCAEELTVAVFDFESKDKGITAVGSKISSMITAELSSDSNLKLVEREKLDNILDELGLSLSGIVSEKEAARIGQLAGAKILVIGRAFTVDGELVVIAKIIATETSRVKAEIVKGSLSGKLITIIDKTAKKVHKVISEKGPSMVASADIVSSEDKLDFLKLKLKDKKLPKVSVSVRERHFGGVTIDPAVETEIIYYLKKLGFTVISQKGDTLAGWAKEYFRNANIEVPRKIEKVDILIIGEAFSELAMRKRNLVSGKARVEIQAIDCKTGRVLAIDRETNTAVDLSEQMAAKKALQEAASNLCYRLIPEFVDNWTGKPKTIAIMDFGNTTGDKKLTKWGKDCAELLTLKLSTDDRFNLVERKEIDKILEEVQLNRSGYVNTKNAIKIGRMLGAQIMVLGILLDVNSHLRLDVHLVEPESGKIVKAEVVEGTSSNLKEMERKLITVISKALIDVINKK